MVNGRLKEAPGAHKILNVAADPARRPVDEPERAIRNSASTRNIKIKPISF
jgi:hypothetical protein